MQAQRSIAREDGEDGETLVINTETSSPMGSASDRFVVDAASMRPIRRDLSQGPATIDVSYGSREVTGTISAGQEIPVSIELHAPVYGGDAALEVVIAGLPLEEGYSAPVRVAEVGMQQRVRYFTITVAGRETIEVPAGEFDAWKVNLEALDGEGGNLSIWVSAEAPRTVLRTEGKLPPQMGGGEYNTVLTGTGE
jgi:hypothetical protein